MSNTFGLSDNDLAALAQIDEHTSPHDPYEHAALFFQRGTVRSAGPFTDGPAAHRWSETRSGGRVVRRTVTVTYGPWEEVED